MKPLEKKSHGYGNENKAIFFILFVVVVGAIFLVASCQKKAERPVYLKKPAAHKVISAKAKVAIVLDDWGYSTRNIGILKEISQPLTLSVLPSLPYSREVANIAKERGKEVILHLPLEPKDAGNYGLEKNTIFTGMSQEQVLGILEADIKSVPGIKGVSNHMGSKATENKDLMRVIFVQLKRKKLFFLDSFTSLTICRQLAKDMGLAYAQRNVFLDNENDYEYIKGQLEAVARLALKNGSAIAVGHDRAKTLEALRDTMPELEKRGIKFVFVSQMLKK